MTKFRRFVMAIMTISVFILEGCGSSGSGSVANNNSATGVTSVDISRYSAGDVEDPTVNAEALPGESLSASSVPSKLLAKAVSLVSNGACGEMGTGFGDYYPWNCTEWAAVRRCEQNQPSVIWSGTGRHGKVWLEKAKDAGYKVGTVPKVGAIAVFRLSEDPCPGKICNKALYTYGHVAYVEKVNGEEWEVSEYNFYYPLKPDTRAFSGVSEEKAPALIGFIYGPDDSTAVDTTPPSIPPLLIANTISSSTLQLLWNSSKDDSGVMGYKICLVAVLSG